MTNIAKLPFDTSDERLLQELWEDLSTLSPEEREEKVLEHLRDLRAERTLEYQIYATREQWLWIPWTTCLAATAVAFTSNILPIRIGVTAVTGTLAFWLVHRRLPGLEGSFDALTNRHKWVVKITNDPKVGPRVRTLGFADRLKVQKDEVQDSIHMGGFRFARYARVWTILLWIAFLSVAFASSPTMSTWISSRISAIAGK